MNPYLTAGQRLLGAWQNFWFGEISPKTVFAVFRIGTATVLLYVLFVRSYDLDPEYSRVVRGDAGLLGAIDVIAWPFSVFQWVDGPIWLWSMHVLALVITTALLAGVASQVMAGLSLCFQLSYAHHYPAMVVGLDGVLMLALAYLALTPSARVLGVLARPEAHPIPPPGRLEREGNPGAPALHPWSGLVLRTMQIHLCLIYFQSALSKLATDWLAGTALWHPRLVALGVPYPLEVLQAEPHLTALITYSLVLFELFYGVLIWIPALRYPVLIVAVAVHLTVGFAWGILPFNVMMVVLNVVFIRPRHLDLLLFSIRHLLFMLKLALARQLGQRP